MSIFLDQSETKITSLLPTIPNAKTSPVLEEIAGADALISTKQYPCTTEQLIKRHVQSGCILVQGKWSIGDLETSIQDARLNTSLARMQSLGARAAQCRLVYIGDISTAMDAQCFNAMDKWMDRGGTVSVLPGIDHVPNWCAMKEKHLEEYEKQPLKWVYSSMPSMDLSEDKKLEALLADELQLLVEVPKGDPRRVLIQAPGIGPELATRWWETINGSVEDTTLFRLLAWMSAEDPSNLPKVEGYAKGKRQKVREWLGLWPGVDLGVKRKEEHND